MSNNTREVFAAYTLLRKSGTAPKDAISYLDARIRQLPTDDQEIFMLSVRQFETQAQQKAAVGGKGSSEDASSNPTHTRLLTRTMTTLQPQVAPTPDGERTYVFRQDMTLALRLPEFNHIFHVKPQQYQRNLVIGRSDSRTNFHADIDLTPFGAAQAGVSRQHMGLVYNYRRQQVIIRDLGSKNGLYLNAKKLDNEAVAVLYNGDQLELGRLIMRVAFKFSE